MGYFISVSAERIANFTAPPPTELPPTTPSPASPHLDQ